MIKVLFSDLDGTLLAVFGERKGVNITDANIKSVKRLLDNGVKFCIASGRNSVYTDQVLEALDLKDGDVIACNGATVQMEGKKQVYTIDKEACLKMLNYYYNNLNMEAYRLTAVEADNTYVADFCDEVFLEKYEKSSYIITKERDLRCYLEDYDKYPGIQKLMVQIHDGQNEKWQNHFVPFCKEFLDVGCPIPKQIELMRKGVNKGTAIDNYINHYGYSIDEVAAIGDADNDIPMLQKATYSYVVENGEEKAKSMAYKVVFDVSECVDDILEKNKND